MKTGLKGFLALLIGFVIVSIFWYVLSSKFISTPEESTVVVSQVKSIVPVVNTTDVKETINFYNKLLGFQKSDSFFDEGEYQWAVIQKGDLKIILKKSDTVNVVADHQLMVINVDNIDDLYNRLKDKLEVAESIYITAQVGKEFSIKDNNGYIIVFRN